MKNSVFINIDTEREQPIIIGKPNGVKPPETQEEAKQMILVDINCVTQGLCEMIHIADQSNYGDKKELIESAIFTLHEMLNPQIKTEE